MQLLEAPVDPLFVLEVGTVLSGGACDGDVDVDIGVLAQELVKRRVDQTDHYGQSIHRLVHLAEVALLKRQELRERALPSCRVVREDHVLDDRQPLSLAEHVLGTRETDAFRAELACEAAFTRRVGVDPHAEAAALVGPREELDQLLLLAEVRGDRRELAGEHLAGRPVDGDRVALLDDLAVDAHLALLKIDVERGDSGDAGQAQTARDDGRVRGRTAARCQDSRRRDHSVEVVRTCLGAHEDDELLLPLQRHGAVGVKHGAPRGRTR